MDFFLIDDAMAELFACAIIKKYQSHRKWRTYEEYENEVKALSKKIIDRFNNPNGEVKVNGIHSS